MRLLPKWWRCPHVRLRGIYGDEIRFSGWYRLQCRDCGRLLEGPVVLAKGSTDE